MSRPLHYDDQFLSLVHSNIQQKVFYCIPMKVQSTAFYQTINLQNAIRICGVYDFLFGWTMFYFTRFNFSIFEWCLIVFAFIACFISVSISNNLNRKSSKYYYYWRLVIVFIIPVFELFSYNSSLNCYYSSLCTNFGFYLGMTIGVSVIHLYLAKIAWSFNMRLQLGQELLIIHGKYLEKMWNTENNKLNNIGKYVPPTVKQNEMEILHFGNGGNQDGKPLMP